MGKKDETNYLQVVWNTAEWLRYAGPKARQEIAKEIREYDYDRRKLVNEKLRKGYIVDLAMDYSDSMYTCGDKFVYLFVDDRSEIYYVGAGGENRFQSWQGRNDDFKRHYKKFNSKVVLAAKFCTAKIAEDVERLLTWKCQLDGYRLTNSDNMLASKELYEIRNISDDWEKDTAIQSAYRRLSDNYSDVLSCFDRIEKWLYSGGIVQSSDWVNKKDETVYTMECWTIDGVTKSRSQWCKEYNVSSSTANGRIDIGCTPKEALTFPAAPSKKRKNVLEWWKEKGFVPGTDETSYVTPVEEWSNTYKRPKDLC